MWNLKIKKKKKGRKANSLYFTEGVRVLCMLPGTAKYRGSALPLGAYRLLSHRTPCTVSDPCEKKKDWDIFEPVSSWEESTDGDVSSCSSDCAAPRPKEGNAIDCPAVADGLYTRMDAIRHRHSYYNGAALSVHTTGAWKGPPRRVVPGLRKVTKETARLVSQSNWEDIFSTAPPVTERPKEKRWRIERVSPNGLVHLLEEKCGASEDLLL